MAIPVRLNGWKLPHKAPESHYSPRKGTRKCDRSYRLFAMFAISGKSATEKMRIVGQALPPARMEWSDSQECLFYNCGIWFFVVT